MATKLGICADLHFGRGGEVQVPQYRRSFNEMILQMIDAGIGALFVAGDTFDKYGWFTPDTVDILMAGFQRLQKELGCSIHIIQGSHDLYRDGVKSAISVFEKIGVYVHDEIEHLTVGYEEYRISLIPWITKVALKAADVNANYAGNEMCREIHNKIVMPSLKQNGVKPGHTNICIFHASLIGFSPTEFDAPIIGTDFLLDPAQIMPLGYDLMIGGHFHRRQSQGNVHYVGSMERNNFAEADYLTGWALIEGNIVTWKELTGPQQYIEYVGELGQDFHSEIGEIDFNNVAVKLKISCSRHDDINEEGLRLPFINAGARLVKVEREYTDEVQVRTDIRAEQSIEQQFKTWESVNPDMAQGGVLSFVDGLEGQNDYPANVSDNYFDGILEGIKNVAAEEANSGTNNLSTDPYSLDAF